MIKFFNLFCLPLAKFLKINIMFKWRCLVLMFLVMGISKAQILNETFDDTSNFTTSTPFFSNGDRAFFGITGDTNDFGSNSQPSGLKPYEGFLGNYLTGMRLNGLGADLPITITWENLDRSEEHTSELQSRGHLVCRLLLEKKNKTMMSK